MPTAKDYLRTARGLIAHPSRWVKGKSSVDEAGFTTTGDQAVCWCATGAVDRAVRLLGTDYTEWDRCYRLLNEAVNRRGCDDIVTFNDSRFTTHSDIILLFEEVERLA